MTRERHDMPRGDFDLDAAIDHVAKRLTHVDDDAQFALRIVAALPERLTWFGWLLHCWAPRLAMAAIIAAGAALWSGRSTTENAPLLTTASVAPMTALATAVRPVRLGPMQRMSTIPVELREPLAPVEPPAPRDHERSLAPARSPAALEIASIAAAELATEAALEVAPLQIAELPLTAESFSQRN